MSITKMTAIAIGFTVAGALIGGGIGYLMGTLTPGLYRAWFPPDPYGVPNDPIKIAAGLGLLQGLAAGFVLGCVVLIATAIRSRRGQVGAPAPEPLRTETD